MQSGTPQGKLALPPNWEYVGANGTAQQMPVEGKQREIETSLKKLVEGEHLQCPVPIESKPGDMTVELLRSCHQVEDYLAEDAKSQQGEKVLRIL